MRSCSRAVLALALLTACGEEPTYPPCTLSLDCPLPDIDVAVLEETTVAGARLELCMDDECAFGALPLPPAGDDPTSAELAGDFRATVRLSREGDLLAVTVHFFYSSPPLVRADGQIYTATVRDANGAVLAAPSWTAEYYGGAGCPDTCGVELTSR